MAKKHEPIEQIFIRSQQGQTRYNLGRDAFRKLAKEANAVVRIGKLVLYDVRRIDEYANANCREE